MAEPGADACTPAAPRRERPGLAAALLALVLVWFALRPLGGQWTDLTGFMEAGRLFLDGRHPYRDAPPGMTVWPPLFVLAAVPLALLGRIDPRLPEVLWQVVNLGALAWSLALLSDLVLGRTLYQALASPLLLVPVALAYPAVTANLLKAQANTILFAMVLQGLVWHARGREAAGGTLLGVAAALKVMPVLLLPYLGWRGHGRTAAWMLVAGLGASLAPVLVLGPAGFLDWLAAWRQDLGHGWGVGYMNQSVPAMWERWLGHHLVPFQGPAARDLATTGAPAVTAAVWGTRLGLAGLVAWRFRGKAEGEGRRTLLEWSVVLVLSAILGPVTWKFYFIVLLLPYVLLASLAADPTLATGPRRGAALLLGSAFFLSTLSSRDLVGKELSVQLEMASSHTLAALLLVFGLLALHARLPPGGRAAPEAVPSPHDCT